MDYNTSRNRLIFPEYGRNVQRMVEHAKTIQDPQERLKAAKTIIEIMATLNPQLRQSGDFEHKLWDHLVIMSRFELQIEGPYPAPQPEDLDSKPERIPYPKHDIKYQHYGHLSQAFLDKASTLEEGAAKESLVRNVANHMKRAYLTWNKDNVDDQTIFDSVRELSEGKIEMGIDFDLEKNPEKLEDPKNQSAWKFKKKKKKQWVRKSNY